MTRAYTPAPARRAFSDFAELQGLSSLIEQTPANSKATVKRTNSDSVLAGGSGRSKITDSIRLALDCGANEFVPEAPISGRTPRLQRSQRGAFATAAEDIAEAIPLVPLAVKFGITAVGLVIRLVIYSMLITPAALRFVYAYFFEPRIIRRVRYGPNRRNYVDIYLPEAAKEAREGSAQPLPVVVGIMGGAWVMGHRSWNTQLGCRLLDADVITVAVDYRNYPIGQIPDMVEDIGRALNWVYGNISVYGGDPENMMVHAQSAGAHLTALLMLERSIMLARGHATPKRTLSMGNLKGCVLMSGPYDLEALQPHVIARGVNAEILRGLCVDGDLAGCSPFLLLETSDWRECAKQAAEHLPPIHFFHGTHDQAVPAWSSTRFAKQLQEKGVSDVTVDIREGFTHTLPILEGPMRGECDMQVELILPFLLGAEAARRRIAALPRRPRLLPECMIRLAMWITPY